jgi:hypothetical protein
MSNETMINQLKRALDEHPESVIIGFKRKFIKNLVLELEDVGEIVKRHTYNQEEAERLIATIQQRIR